MSSSRLSLALVIAVTMSAPAAFAQLGEMISPGPLTKAHVKLEGVANCVRCHAQGRQVSAARCLECHEPVAKRIAQRRGVHRNVKDDCVACHVEHMGRDAELRPFDTKRFDHRVEAGFALEGRHATLECVRCHRKRSFLDLDPRCTSCHSDPHKGALGTDCARCHSVEHTFKESTSRFDHSRTAYPLEGAHRNVPCAKCHSGGKYKGLAFQSCTGCHRSPHERELGPTCSSCHSPASWRVENFDHARTGTPLAGRHRNVACAKCHVKPAAQVSLSLRPCAACHRDPHAGRFPKDCASCHDERSFKGAAFDHATTRFPLTGRHAALACGACHRKAGAPTANFSGLKSECSSCHRDPHRGELGANCERCHSSSSFKVSSFTHPRFPEFFSGQHATVACDKCHPVDTKADPPVRLLKNRPTECAACHRDVHLGQLPDCQRCHSVAAAKFAAPGFRHEQTSFKLTGRHAEVPCASCHLKETAPFPAGSGDAVRYRGVLSDCAACHKDVHLGQLGADCASCHDTRSFRVDRYVHRNPGGFFRGKHAAAPCDGCHKKVEAEFPAGRGVAVRFSGLSTDCTSCHSDPHAGQLGTACQSCHGVDAAWSNASRAFHKAGLFPLEGRHLTTPCADCHRNGVTKGTPTRCYDCHWIRRQDDRFHTALGNDCENCHRPIGWTAVTWNHTANTGFPLSASHQGLACDGCHEDGTFAAARAGCESCHLEAWAAAREPNHQAAGFPLVCQLCHRASDTSWSQARFDHSSFALAGVHLSAPCASCHVNAVWQGTPRDCASCHRKDLDDATSPDHRAAGFSEDCASCHHFTDASWNLPTWSHQGWQLVGSHLSATCSDCHTGTVYAGLSKDCSSCHRDDYDAATEPQHAAAGFPLTCELCHRVNDPAWDLGKFDHTTFALAGIHQSASCGACHTGGVYQGTARDCAGCHRTDYDAAQQPVHAAAGFPLTCDSCHRFTDTTWQEGRFDHTSFALAGAHGSAECGACHAGGVYAGTPRDCAGCHLADFNATTRPNHLAAAFPSTCETCHKFTDASWDLAVYTHDAFPLAGAHLQPVCAACHGNGVYASTPRNCAGCHQDDFNQATDPSHTAAAFPTTCDTCHKFTDLSWDLGVYGHDTFPLAGTHLQQVCAACHAGGVYRGTSRNCSGCHQDDYDGTTDPKHTSAGFPTSCETCHRFADLSWDAGSFSHTTFALRGTHATEPCTSCHAGGVFVGTPRLCNGCHQDDYGATTDPSHAAAGFPTTCENCHKDIDSSWDQGLFDHSTFALLGAHSSEPCTSCHASGVYAGTPRLCSGCHLDDYDATTDPKHSTTGFPTTCQDCHRFTDSSWDQGDFDHSSFTLRGVHSSEPCTSCHSGGVYQGTPRTCSGCHLDDYNGTSDPNHSAAGFPTSCEDCHRFSDTSWAQGVFNHAFPIRSGDHSGEPCNSCHLNNSNYALFTCTNCHTRGETDPEHDEEPGYVWSSPACYSCHPNGEAD